MNERKFSFPFGHVNAIKITVATDFSPTVIVDMMEHNLVINISVWLWQKHYPGYSLVHLCVWRLHIKQALCISVLKCSYFHCESFTTMDVLTMFHDPLFMSVLFLTILHCTSCSEHFRPAVKLVKQFRYVCRVIEYIASYNILDRVQWYFI